MADQSQTAVPTVWLRQVAELLYDLCGEGICIVGRSEPEDLMQELAEHLNLESENDLWAAAVEKLGGHVDS